MSAGRPSFHEINMLYALKLAERSTCLRGIKVGTVITSTDFRKVLAIGYNGNASGLSNHCDRTGPEAVGNCGCLHAEENAVINCDVPRQTEKIVFCTHLPCVACSKRLINLGGVKEVYYLNDYRVRVGLDVLGQVGIDTFHMDLGGTSSPVLCEHANEVPHRCPCPPNCYCKTNTCESRVVPIRCQHRSELMLRHLCPCPTTCACKEDGCRHETSPKDRR